jgi:hypothetical protein
MNATMRKMPKRYESGLPKSLWQAINTKAQGPATVFPSGQSLPGYEHRAHTDDDLEEPEARSDSHQADLSEPEPAAARRADSSPRFIAASTTVRRVGPRDDHPPVSAYVDEQPARGSRARNHDSSVAPTLDNVVPARIPYRWFGRSNLLPMLLARKSDIVVARRLVRGSAMPTRCSPVVPART